MEISNFVKDILGELESGGFMEFPKFSRAQFGTNGLIGQNTPFGVSTIYPGSILFPSRPALSSGKSMHGDLTFQNIMIGVGGNAEPRAHTYVKENTFVSNAIKFDGTKGLQSSQYGQLAHLLSVDKNAARRYFMSWFSNEIIGGVYASIEWLRWEMIMSAMAHLLNTDARPIASQDLVATGVYDPWQILTTGDWSGAANPLEDIGEAKRLLALQGYQVGGFYCNPNTANILYNSSYFDTLSNMVKSRASVNQLLEANNYPIPTEYGHVVKRWASNGNATETFYALPDNVLVMVGRPSSAIIDDSVNNPIISPEQRTAMNNGAIGWTEICPPENFTIPRIYVEDASISSGRQRNVFVKCFADIRLVLNDTNALVIMRLP